MNKGEREISIKDIIFDILKNWKIILFVGVILGVCICTYSTYNDRKAYDMVNDLIDRNLTYKELEQEQPQVYKVLKMYKMLDAYEEYKENALIMKVDPSNVTHLRINFYVDSQYKYNYLQENEKDYSYAIMAYYSTFLQSREFVDMLIDKLQLVGDAANYEDLVKIEINASNMMIAVDVICDNVNINDVEKTINEIIVSKKNEMQVIGEHEIKLLDSYVKTVIDSNVKAVQEKIELEITNLNQQIDQMSQLILPWQKEYVNYCNAVEEDSAYKLSKPGVNIKMLSVGLILGMFFCVVIYVIKGALSAKVQNKNDIFNIFGISTISEIKSKINHEEQEDYIITLVKKKCSKENALEVYFISSVMEKINTEMFNRIVDKLNKEGLKTMVLGNPCNDKNSLEKLNSNGVAILVEKVKVSHYDEIEKEIKLLYDNDVAVLGTIIL